LRSRRRLIETRIRLRLACQLRPCLLDRAIRGERIVASNPGDRSDPEIRCYNSKKNPGYRYAHPGYACSTTLRRPLIQATLAIRRAFCGASSTGQRSETRVVICRYKSRVSRRSLGATLAKSCLTLSIFPGGDQIATPSSQWTSAARSLPVSRRTHRKSLSHSIFPRC